MFIIPIIFVFMMHVLVYLFLVDARVVMSESL